MMFSESSEDDGCFDLDECFESQDCHYPQLVLTGNLWGKVF